MNLVQRSIQSITWISFFSLLTYPVTLVQSILLARFLPIETFGIFIGISSIAMISYIPFDFGLTNAFIHRSDETQNEDQAATTLFTLRLILDTIWAFLLLVFGYSAFHGESKLVLIVLVITSYLNKFTVTPRAILTRRVQHRRPALIDFVVSMSAALISILVAWYSRSIWALLTSTMVTFVVTITGYYFIQPIWRPRFNWQKPTIQYFFSFGVKNMVNRVLDSIMDNIDNLWTRQYLGDRQLGFYSRAYKFAAYPRILLVLPINSVLIGTFSELKHDRLRLSKAFFRINVGLTRIGFLLAGGLAVIAPEFIQLFLGDKWLPILDSFRIMLIFAIFDPLRMAVSAVFVAVGKPEKMGAVRSIQLLALIIGLFTLGIHYQILGVALSLDIAALFGLVLSIYLSRQHIDFSIKKLLSPPIFALIIGFTASWTASWLVSTLWNDFSLWLALLIKGSTFCVGYLGIIYIFEGKVLFQSLIDLIQQYRLKPMNDRSPDKGPLGIP